MIEDEPACITIKQQITMNILLRACLTFGKTPKRLDINLVKRNSKAEIIYYL